MELYRSNLMDPDGSPRVGDRFAELGSRQRPGGGGDIHVGQNGGVLPGMGGLSVWSPRDQAVATVSSFPTMFPKAWGGKMDRFGVFMLEDAQLPLGLEVVEKESRDGWLIQPSRPMSIQKYRALLRGTKPYWKRILKP